MTPRALLTLGFPFLGAVAVLPSACAPRTPTESRVATFAALGTAPPLGAAASFVVLAGTTVTNTGATTIDGDLGVSPGLAVTGFPPGIVSDGTIHAGDAVALQAQSDTTSAYGVLAGEACGTDLTGTDLGGLTLAPGVYCFSSSAQLTGTLVLDAAGDAGAVFVFQMTSTLITASHASVQMINGGNSCGVFWQVGSSAVVGTGTSFSGSIVALTSISLATGATVSGRALARNGAVTMEGNAVGGCTIAPVVDAGGLDAAPIDSGTTSPESGTIDAATIDSSVPIDSGAGVADAGAADAAVEDAGQVDTGATLDAGAPDACCEDTVCGGACVDLTTDMNNCGACGTVCAATLVCIAGSCTSCDGSDR